MPDPWEKFHTDQESSAEIYKNRVQLARTH